jgi:transposase
VDYRKAKGREIALLGRVTRKRGVWLVPSHNRAGLKYVVKVNGPKPSCTCPDFVTNGKRCKHIHAVIFHSEYPKAELVDPPPPPVKTRKKTYKQNWTPYNYGQTHEKEFFLRLLKGLCDTIPTETKKTVGRPAIPIRDAVFAACFKVFHGTSTRRFMTDLRWAHSFGFISRAPCPASVMNVIANEHTTEILHELIRRTSAPLSDFEQDFAVDSSGFGLPCVNRWLDTQHRTIREQHQWTKVHIICGTKTHIIPAVVIRDKDATDPKQLPELVRAAANNFTLREVSADKAYGSISNYAVIAECGATPYIAFKENHTGASGGLFGKMYHQFQFHREAFLTHYHKRSNVETAFSMIKAKFHERVFSKSETAAMNEVLCKVICHNICRLIAAMLELNLNLDYLLVPQKRVPNLQVIEGGLA